MLLGVPVSKDARGLQDRAQNIFEDEFDRDDDEEVSPQSFHQSPLGANSGRYTPSKHQLVSVAATDVRPSIQTEAMGLSPIPQRFLPRDLLEIHQEDRSGKVYPVQLEIKSEPQ